MAVCLVTGGAGFIGSHLVDALLARGHAVRVLDDLSTGRRENLAAVADQVEFVEGSLMDPGVVRAAAQGVEILFHLAAPTPLLQRAADPMTVHAMCATGTLHVLEAARAARVRRVIYASCASVYGNSGRLPLHEAAPLHPVGTYAVAKLAGEQYCMSFSLEYGLETVRLRAFHVYGPRQPWGDESAAVVPRFLEAMVQGRNPVIFGDGLQSRDFTFVGDVVQACLLAADTPRARGTVYNVGSGRATTLLELVDALNALLGTRCKPQHVKARAGDIRHSQADILHAQAELGYCPSTDLFQGLRHCLEYYSGRHWRKEAAEDHSPHLIFDSAANGCPALKDG